MARDFPSREEVLALMTRSPLFRGLSAEDLDALRAIGIRRAAAKGELLFLEGDDAEGFFLVLSGSVKLLKLSPAGKEQILHVHSAPDVFAEGVLFPGARYPASAAATADVRLLLFPRREFQRLIGDRPVLATNLIARLSGRLRQLTALVEDLSLKEAPARLARHLLELPGRESPEGPVVRLKIKKGELASLLGTRGETLSRLFRRLSDAGVIRVRASEVTILDPDRLEDVAAGESSGV